MPPAVPSNTTSNTASNAAFDKAPVRALRRLPDSSAAASPTASRRRPPAPWRDHGRRAPWLGDSQATAHGGLLMLLNGLQAMAYPRWLAAQPLLLQQGFTRALLARVAARLRLPDDDPQAPLLRLPPPLAAELAHAVGDGSPPAWPRGFDIRGLAWTAPGPVAATALLAAWQRALALALRRHAGIGLARLVLREAGVSVTPTHVDLVLPLAQADVVLRRAGLDADPGWLPWFGWIVAFHYIDAGTGSAHGAG
jgi:hypothetical protein